MGRWDEKEKRDSDQEEFNCKIGKYLLTSGLTGSFFTTLNFTRSFR